MYKEQEKKHPGYSIVERLHETAKCCRLRLSQVKDFGNYQYIQYTILILIFYFDIAYSEVGPVDDMYHWELNKKYEEGYCQVTPELVSAMKRYPSIIPS